nr:hypothetical protein GCM10020092_100600 [Actinoplanes digitatis]
MSCTTAYVVTGALSRDDPEAERLPPPGLERGRRGREGEAGGGDREAADGLGGGRPARDIGDRAVRVVHVRRRAGVVVRRGAGGSGRRGVVAVVERWPPGRGRARPPPARRSC